MTILASGSEVDLAINISHKLAKDKIYSKVISMPCMELFDLQSSMYKNKIINETKFKISIEAGSSDCWKKYLGNSYSYLSNKNSNNVLRAQFEATQNVFIKRKIPFRSFVIKKRDEKSLGELFCFFILETIMLGKALKINPFNQPEVELIKKETYKILKN